MAAYECFCPMTLSTADKILNAAEELFSASGYDAVSIRQITQAAGVKLALVHYHFGSKEELYRAVIQRRIGRLSECRMRLLDQYLDEADGEPLAIEKIVQAFITPYLFWHLHGGNGWRSYSRLVSRLLMHDLDILTSQFNPTAERFIAELRRSMPDAREKSVQWGFDFMVGLMCNTFSETDRIATLSHGQCSVEDKLDACQNLVSFVTAGLLQLSANRKSDLTDPLKSIARFTEL